MNPVINQKREVLAAFAREYVPAPKADTYWPDFRWETRDQLARRELGEMLRPFATRPQDIPDDVVERAWALYLLSIGGPPAELFQLPRLTDLKLPLEFVEPERPVSVHGLTLTQDEIKTLWLAAIETPSIAIFGEPPDYSDPLVFHRTMTESPEKLVVDADTATSVWNSRGKLAEEPFSGERPASGVHGPVGDGELVKVSVVPIDPPPHAGADYLSPKMQYWLELGKDGQPVNGGWISQPDFLWSQEPALFFDRDLAIRVYQESIAPDGTGQLGEATWAGMSNQWAALLSGRPLHQFSGLRFDEPENIRVERPSLEEQIRGAVSGLMHSASSMIYGLNEMKVSVNPAARPEGDGFAGPAGDGTLSRIDFSWTEARSGEKVSGSLWVEQRDGAVVNGGWLGAVPETFNREIWVIEPRKTQP